MRRDRILQVLAAVAAAVTGACDGTGSNPAEVLRGDWGGPGAKLIASADTVTLELQCLRGGFTSVPTLADRRFTATAELRAVNYVGTVQVRGTVTSSWLRLTLVFPEPGTSEQAYVLRQGAEGEFGERLCPQ